MSFGTIISDDVVEDAVIAVLKRWLPTYLSEVEAQRGLTRGFYERPAPSSYTVRNDFDKWPEDFLPAVIVVSPGMPDEPVKDGRRRWRGSFDIGVACVVSSLDRDETRRFAQRMGAAVRALLIDHPSLEMAIGGNVRGLDWLGERNNLMPPEDERSIWANRQLFSVEVDQILERTGGPAEPEPDPQTPPPPTDVEITSVDSDERIVKVIQ